MEGRNEKERKSNYKMRAERVTKFHRSPERDVNSHSVPFSILSPSIMNLGLTSPRKAEKTNQKPKQEVTKKSIRENKPKAGGGIILGVSGHHLSVHHTPHVVSTKDSESRTVVHLRHRGRDPALHDILTPLVFQ